MYVEDVRNGIRAVISQYAKSKGVVVNREFAIDKIKEEMLELSEALSDGSFGEKTDAVSAELADVLGMLFVLSDVIGVDPIKALEKKWFSKLSEIGVTAGTLEGNGAAYDSSYVDIGVGVIIQREDGRILIGKRIGKHAPYYSIPGGKIEVGETFEQAAIREVSEETGLSIFMPKVIGVTNNLETFSRERFHAVSVILASASYDGDVELKEPEACEGWLWADPHRIPEPHFEASAKGVRCHLEKSFYASDA